MLFLELGTPSILELDLHINIGWNSKNKMSVQFGIGDKFRFGVAPLCSLVFPEYGKMLTVIASSSPDGESDLSEA